MKDSLVPNDQQNTIDEGRTTSYQEFEREPEARPQ
jgi:hypothetical protein